MADEQEEVPPLDDLGLTGFGYDLPPPTPELTEQRRREQDYIDYMAQFPGYQTILDDTRKNYTPKGWIKSPVHLPRFTNDEFEEMKKNYQAKYGSTIVIPKFEETRSTGKRPQPSQQRSTRPTNTHRGEECHHP